MPTYVAFLRAINLGATRRFPTDRVVAATEAAGGRGVATYLATGNVRLDSRRRSPGAVAAALEEAYLAETGFEVPAVVLTAPEVAEVVATADRLAAEHGPPRAQALMLYVDPPAADAVARVDVPPPDRLFVDGRVAHLFLHGGFQGARWMGTRAFADLGVGTSRTLNVVREVSRRWCA